MALPDEGWLRRSPIDFKPGQVASTQSNIVVTLIGVNFPAEINDSGDPNHAKEGGLDLRITTDQAGTIEIPVHVVTFVLDGEIEVKIKVPSLDGVIETRVWAHYNNPAASLPLASDPNGQYSVYPSSYKGAYPMKNLNDSTVNQNTLNAVGAPGTTPGVLGDAYDLDASQKYLRILTAGADDFKIIGDLTASILLNADLIRPHDGVFTSQGAFPPDSEARNVAWEWRQMGGSGSNDHRYFHEYGPGSNELNTWNTASLKDTWYRHTLIRDTAAKTVILMVNGQKFGSTFNYTNNPTGATDNDFIIGQLGGYAPTADWEGQVDEVNIQDAKMTEDWDETIYNNQFFPSTFAIPGTPEDSEPEPEPSDWPWPGLTQPSIEYDGNTILFPVPAQCRLNKGINQKENIGLDKSIENINMGYPESMSVRIAPVFDPTFKAEMLTFFRNWGGKKKFFTFTSGQNDRYDGIWWLETMEWRPLPGPGGQRIYELIFKRVYN